MKYIFVLVFLFINILQAEYLRTIRIASFQTKLESQQALAELQEFIVFNQNIIDLQKEWDFEFKARRSGKYYITLVEPFTQRKVLQEVLNTLRINYPDVYVTRLKKKDLPLVKQAPITLVIIEEIKEKNTIPIQEKKVEPFVEEEIVVVEEVIPKEVLQEEVPEVSKLTIPQEVFQDEVTEVAELTINKGESTNTKEIPEVIKIKKEKKDDTQEVKVIDNLKNYIWQTVSFLLAITLFYILIKMLKYKRENETYFNTQLIQNEKYEQLSLEVKDREKYLSHASHELRTPMTAIMGITHLVLDANLEAQEKEYIKQIESSAANLLNIVNDILDVSKIKAGELHIEKVEFNINDMLEYVLNTISMQVKKNNINCFIDIGKEVPSHLIGDSLRLGQVLINLLGNAVKFTKDGEVSLSVKKISDYGDSVRIRFIVSDNGIGMSSEQLENIFQSFSQANSSTTRKFGGTGLGLSISQELVGMMNGEIKVKSELDKGTSFTFNIPFKLKDHLNKRQYRLPSTKFLNKRILLVDASSKNIRQLTPMLGYFKYKTHSIPSFEEVVLDDAMEFDIVILNKNQLTEENITKLIKMQKQQGFKIVILNELFSNLNNELLHNLQVDAYLQLPLHQQKVLNVLIDLYASKKLNNKSRLKTSKNILQDIVNKRILVAEDNEVNHKVISGLLAQTGIEITYVTNGKEALDLLLGGKRFDLILMDISMPIMDGYEATTEIRRHIKFNDIPILALTADVMQEAIDKALGCGMQGHISKPIIIDIFYKKIYDVLQEKKIKLDVEQLSSGALDKDSEYSEISIMVGLERYNNDQEFYSNILKDFKKMYINSPIDLEDLCRVGNYKEARHKAMDIKDVSLSIGAYNLCESAATMEYSLEQGPRSNWAKLIDFYELELDKLFKDIDKYLKKHHS